MSTASDAASDRGAEAPAAGTRRTAGAYDVRVVIAALIGLYGIVLVILGFVDYSDEDKVKTGDVNANLWAGIAMVVVAVVFVLWVRLRPIVVDPAALQKEKGEGTSDGSDIPPH